MTSKSEILFGPPGCGKTQALLGIVDEELSAGTHPRNIAFVTFTRRGAEEAVSRARKRGATLDDLTWFKTIHALCFKYLEKKSFQTFQGSHLKAFGDYAGIEVNSRRWSEDGTLTGFGEGDRCLFMQQLARVRRIPLRQQYDEGGDDDLSWRLVEYVSTKLREYKENEGLIDYTDMLEEFVRLQGQIKGLEVLVVDEVQDNTLLQWQVIELLGRTCRRKVCAGDDDQAIFGWAGADVSYMLNMEGDQRVLGQSYRVPRQVQEVALSLTERMVHRREKVWAARDEDGDVDRVGYFDKVDLSDDSVLVLARNAYLLEPVITNLREQGIIYERDGHSSIKPKIMEAATAWEDLRAGRSTSLSQAKIIYEFMTTKIGVKHGYKELKQLGDDLDRPVTMDLLQREGGLLRDGIWHEALDRLPRSEMLYILAARRRGEKLRQRPRVRLSTIHSAKGGEADHVVLLKAMAPRSYNEIHKDRDAELRVWYVGATRARKRMTIVESMTEERCPWL